MKVTKHFCDFSEMVPQHPAHFHLRAEEKEGPASKDRDTCLLHLCKMAEDWFRSGESIRQVFIVRILDVELPARGQTTLAPDGGELLPCPEGCTVKRGGFNGRASLNLHMKRTHGIPLHEYEAKQV